MPKHAEFSSPAIFLITIPTSFPPPPEIITKFFSRSFSTIPVPSDIVEMILARNMI